MTLHWFNPARAEGIDPHDLAGRLAPFGVRVKWDGAVPVGYFTDQNDPAVLMMELGTLTYSDRNGTTVRPRAGLSDAGLRALLGSVEPLTIMQSPKRDPGWGRRRGRDGSWWTTCISVPVPDDHGFLNLMARNPMSAEHAAWVEMKEHGRYESTLPVVASGQVTG